MMDTLHNLPGDGGEDCQKEIAQEAIFNLDRAIFLKNDMAEYYRERGCAYSWLGDPEKAINDYSKCIELDKKDEFCYRERSYKYKAIGEYEKAVGDLTTLTNMVDLKCFKRGIYQERARLYLELDEYDNAIQDANTVQNNFSDCLDPVMGKSDIFLIKGKAYLGKGGRRKAFHELKRSCDLWEKGEACNLLAVEFNAGKP